MQPSERYVFEDVTLNGFTYKRTTEDFGTIFPLYSNLDTSIAYTMPITLSYRKMTPTLINKQVPQRGLATDTFFQDHYYSNAGHTNQAWSTLGEVIGNPADDKSCVLYWTFADATLPYYFNGSQGNATIGTSTTKFISGFDISHLIFQANIKGYTKAQYDAYKSTGGNQTEGDITLEDLIDNPNDYFVSRFNIQPVAYWDDTNHQWRSNPPVYLTCLIDAGEVVQGVASHDAVLFGNQTTASVNYMGINRTGTYHLQCTTQSYKINDSTYYKRLGGIPAELDSNNPYSLGTATDWHMKPSWDADALRGFLDAQSSNSDNNTNSPELILSTGHGEIYGYDSFNVRQNFSGAPQGQFHYSLWDKKLSAVAYGLEVSSFIASAGCYFQIGNIDNNYYNTLNNNNITPNTLHLRPEIGLGVMLDDGTTNGQWILGEDIDDYEGINKFGSIVHPDFHPSPNPPSGGGDELLDMKSRGQFYGSGLTKYYVDPPAVKLQKALGSWDNIATGKDVLKNLLSYKILCFPSTAFSNGVTDPFVIAGVELHDEDDNVITAKRLTSTGAINLPSIPIPKTFYDFRDYAPYTTLQMFVPLCGWVTLPPWCMGRTISGEMYINPYSGTVRCLVRADGNVVAEMGGNASIDLPFSADAVGMKSAAVISSILNTAGAVGSAIAMPNVSTIAHVGSAALGTVCALNANYTESKGSMGDGSNVYGLYNVYIKITRPATIDDNGNDIKTIPAQYKHDHGIPCAKSLTISAGDGYTQVLDANITGTMTAAEKQMIIDGFRHGLIISANPS